MRLTATAMVVALVVAACSQGPAARPTEAPDPQGTLTTFLHEDPQLTDPQSAGNLLQVKVVLMVYEGLLRPDPKTLRPAPAAADLPTVSVDGRTYLFRVRQGQTYSDGAPLTARDFAYGLSRLCDPNVAGPYAPVAFVIVGCEEWADLDPAKETPQRLKAARDALFERGLRVNADHELEIRLTRPAAYLPSFLSLWVSAPVRERDVQRGGDNWWSDPAFYVGNGPFVLAERITDDRLVFERNPRARVPAKLSRWTIRVGPQELTPDEWDLKKIEAYRSDMGDVVQPGPPALAVIEQDERLRAELTEIPAACTSYLRFDTSVAPFDDAKLRLALAKSIDRDAFVRVEAGRRKPATSLIAPGVPGHDPADEAQRYDVTAARRLFSESAYGAGRSVPLAWPYAMPRQKATNDWIAAQWKETLGIEVTPKLVSVNEFQELFRRAATSPRLLRHGWCADYPDQQNWLSTLFHSTSRMRPGACDAAALSCPPSYASAGFDRLVDQADALADQAKRDELYLQASRLLSADAPAIWLGYSTDVILAKSWVRGLNPSAIDAGGMFHPADVYVVRQP